MKRSCVIAAEHNQDNTHGRNLTLILGILMKYGCVYKILESTVIIAPLMDNNSEILFM